MKGFVSFDGLAKNRIFVLVYRHLSWQCGLQADYSICHGNCSTQIQITTLNTVHGFIHGIVGLKSTQSIHKGIKWQIYFSWIHLRTKLWWISLKKRSHFTYTYKEDWSQAAHTQTSIQQIVNRFHFIRTDLSYLTWRTCVTCHMMEWNPHPTRNKLITRQIQIRHDRPESMYV